MSLPSDPPESPAQASGVRRDGEESATRPILYSFRRCPYAMRARLAIASAGVEVELREVVLRAKPEAFLATSPTGTVPCLRDTDGRVLDESLDIMLWALGINDPEGWLGPRTAAEEGTAVLDTMLAIVREVDGPFKAALDRYKYPPRFPQDDPLEARAAASDFLRGVDARLGESGFLFGPQGALGDFAFLPFLRQFANVDRDWFDGEPWERLSAALERFESSARFARIMGRPAPWSPGAAPLIFP